MESVTQQMVASTSRVGPREYSPGECNCDVVICIVLPALCMLLDPGVLRASSWNGEALVSARVSVFLQLDWLTAVSALLLLQRLRHRGSLWLPVLGGVLLVGAVSAAALGVRMSPWTLLAMVALLGLPGFLPFVSAFGFARAGMRALSAGAVGRSNSRMVAVAVAGALVVVGVGAGCAQFVVMRVETAARELFASPDHADTSELRRYLAVFGIQHAVGRIIDTLPMSERAAAEAISLQKLGIFHGD